MDGGPTIQIWDLEVKQGQGMGFPRAKTVTSVAFSPDGKRILCGIEFAETPRRSAVAILDSKTPKQVQFLNTGTNSVNAVAMSADSAQILTGGSDGVVRLWDMEKDTSVSAYKRQPGPVSQVTFSPDGSMVLVVANPSFAVLDTATGRPLCSQISAGETIRAASFINEGKDVLWTTQKKADGKVLHYSNTNPLRHATSPDKPPAALAKAPLATSHLVAGLRDLVAIANTGESNWLLLEARPNVPEPTLLKEFVGHKARITALVLSSDGKRGLSSAEDKTLRLWDLNEGKEIATLEGLDKPATAIAISPDGKRALSGDGGSSVQMWDLEGRRGMGAIKSSNEKGLACFVFSPNGEQVLYGIEFPGATGLAGVTMTDNKTGAQLFIDIMPTPSCVASSPDHKFIAAGSKDKVVRVWKRDQTQPPIHKLLGLPESVNQVDFSAGGDMVMATSLHSLHVWDVATGRRLQMVKPPGGAELRSACFVNGGKEVLYLTWKKAEGKIVLLRCPSRGP